MAAIGTGKGGWLGVAVFTAAVCLISAAAALTARETHHVPTEDLGAAHVRRVNEPASATRGG